MKLTLNPLSLKGGSITASSLKASSRMAQNFCLEFGQSTPSLQNCFDTIKFGLTKFIFWVVFFGGFLDKYPPSYKNSEQYCSVADYCSDEAEGMSWVFPHPPSPSKIKCLFLLSYFLTASLLSFNKLQSWS